MLKGRVDVIGRDLISGWVADPADPRRIIEVAVFVDGVERARALANRARADLRALGIYGEGNHGFSIVLAPPLTFADDHDVIVHPISGTGTLERGHFKIAARLNGEQSVLILENTHEDDDEAAGQVIEPPPATPRYVVHIGPHKTGTTYLQIALSGCSAELRAAGVLYPDESSGWVATKGYSHTELPRILSALDTASLTASFDALNESGCGTVLLSSEDLVGVLPEGLRCLKSQIAGRPTEVLFYCRRWSELLPSAWQETIKQGKTHSLGEFIAAQLADPMRSSIINFDIILGKYADIFGIENIKLVSYNDLVDAKKDIFDHFIQSVLNLDRVPTITRTATNQSLDRLDVETVRLLNEVAIMRSEKPSVEIFQRYWRNRSNPHAQRLHQAMASYPDTVRIDDSGLTLRVVHDFIFEKYGRCLIDPSGERRLFKPATRDLPFIQSGYMLSTGVIPNAIALYDDISQ